MHVLNHNGTLLLCPHYSYRCIGLLCAQPGAQHFTCEPQHCCMGGQCPYPVYGRGDRHSRNERT